MVNEGNSPLICVCALQACDGGSVKMFAQWQVAQWVVVAVVVVVEAVAVAVVPIRFF